MAVPPQLDLPVHYSGDTWPGISEIKATSGLNLTGATVVMQVRQQAPGNPVLFTLSSTNTAQIEILSATNPARFIVKPRVVTATTPGTYLFDIQATLADSTVITLITGRFPIKKDVAT